MRHDMKIGGDLDRLKFRLLPGEDRAYIARLRSRVVYSTMSAQGEPYGSIVLFHGVGSNASRWEEFVERTPLKQHWQLIRMDLRGHGSSETKAPGTLENHAEDAVAILDALGLQKAVFMGHSLGAHIALTVAQRYPQRVQALVLVDPLIEDALTPAAKKKRAWRPLLRAIECVARVAGCLGIRRRMPFYSLRAHDEKAREMLAQGGGALEAFIKEYSSPFKDLGHIHVADYTRDLLEISRISPSIDGFQGPVLVVASSSGRITYPEKMRSWTSTLAAGEMATVNCVHWPFTECPEEISRIVQDWISRACVARHEA